MNEHPPRNPAFDLLADELEAAFGEAPSGGWSDDRFANLAHRVFRCQFDANEPYRVFCERRGVTPDTLAAWRDAPAVPARAFKHLDLGAWAGEAEAAFATSGTTRGPAARGRHSVARLSLYRASLLPPFRRHVIGTGAGPPSVFLSLIPAARSVPDSSLSYMVTAAGEAIASEVRYAVDARGGLDVGAVVACAEESRASGEPVVVLGTALAFVHLLERLAGRPARFARGSRVMETGGFKGAAREVPRDELHATIAGALGVRRDAIVNEYGMTELLSQLYEPVLSEGPSAAGVHEPAPWLRVRALDPSTLEERVEGEEGILAFFDLANLGSVSHVLTEDVGSVIDGRVRLRGRLRGSEPRGCSRAMDELLASTGRPA